MDRYILPLASTPTSLRPIRRRQWKWIIAELSGKISSKNRHLYCKLLLESYRETGALSHCGNINGESCPTYFNRLVNDASQGLQIHAQREGISALEFDNKGIYLAAVTKSGCLTVHDCDSLLSLSTDQSSSCVDEAKQVLHIATCQQLDVVRWNKTNQDEVACASLRKNSIPIFDIGYVSSDPVEVLKVKHCTLHGSEVTSGLSDMAFTSDDKSRLFACGRSGLIYAWDRRLSNHQYLELSSNSHSPLNSIQLNMEEWIIFAASQQGIVYAWDLRGGRTSVAFQSHNELYNPPLTSIKLSSMLEKITSLKAQSDIISKEIHSIDFDPSCPYQLAFHLDDGWSGVLNTHSLGVTHVHCPPPAWLDAKDSSVYADFRKPAWLPACSIYAVGSSSSDGLHLLDFFPHKTSACHVDFDEGAENISGDTEKRTPNTFIPLSAGVTACVAHPLNGTIVAGTKSSLVVLSHGRSVSPSENAPTLASD